MLGLLALVLGTARMAAQAPDIQLAPLPATLPGTVVPIPTPPSNIWWSVPIGAAPNASPVIAADHIYIGRLPGIVSAHHLSDGRELWSVEMNAEGPLAAESGLLFVASGEAVHALRETDGATAWRRPIGTLSAPLLAKDGWIIAAGESQLSALRAADGTPVWTQKSGPHRERPAISGDMLFVPLADGRIEARDLSTGAVRWQRRLGGAPAEPLAAGDRLFFGATDKQFYSLDADSGEIEWQRREGATLRGRASTDGERVYFAGLDNMVRAVDFGHGALRWHKGVPFRPAAGPMSFGESLLVVGRVADIQVLRGADGRPVGTLTMPKELAVAPMAVERRGRILVAAITGGLDESWNLSVAALPLVRTTAPTKR